MFFFIWVINYRHNSVLTVVDFSPTVSQINCIFINTEEMKWHKYTLPGICFPKTAFNITFYPPSVSLGLIPGPYLE